MGLHAMLVLQIAQVRVFFDLNVPVSTDAILSLIAACQGRGGVRFP